MLLILFEPKPSRVKVDRLFTNTPEGNSADTVRVQIQLRQSRQTIESPEGMLLMLFESKPATSTPTDCRTPRKECC